jgi:quercetin dioxygenase-like cupin family protein
MKISEGRMNPRPSEHRLDPTRYPHGARLDWLMHVEPDDGFDIRMSYAFHAPGGQTVWHSHAGGQIIYVLSGLGVWGSRNDGVLTVHRVRAGDAVYFEPDEVHFQAASPDAYILELTCSVGVSSYYEPITDEEYATETPER